MLRIAYLIHERGMSQTELAQRAGVNRVLLNRILHGKLPPYPKWRDAIAAAIGYDGDPSELFEEIEVK